MNWRLSKRSVGERYEDEAVKASDFTLAACAENTYSIQMVSANFSTVVCAVF